MIIITGKVINIVDKEPYKNKKGDMVSQCEIDLKDSDERRYNTIACPPDKVSEIEEGDEIAVVVRQFGGVSKNGNYYLINSFVDFYTE
jgi:hypothetical protein